MYCLENGEFCQKWLDWIELLNQNINFYFHVNDHFKLKIPLFQHFQILLRDENDKICNVYSNQFQHDGFLFLFYFQSKEYLQMVPIVQTLVITLDGIIIFKNGHPIPQPIYHIDIGLKISISNIKDAYTCMELAFCKKRLFISPNQSVLIDGYHVYFSSKIDYWGQCNYMELFCDDENERQWYIKYKSPFTQKYISPPCISKYNNNENEIIKEFSRIDIQDQSFSFYEAIQRYFKFIEYTKTSTMDKQFLSDNCITLFLKC